MADWLRTYDRYKCNGFHLLVDHEHLQYTMSARCELIYKDACERVLRLSLDTRIIHFRWREVAFSLVFSGV